MEEKTFLLFALIISIIGMIGLFFCTLYITAPLVAIQDISLKNKGETIQIEGEILSFSQREQMIFITLQDDTGKIPLVGYGEEFITIRKGNFVRVDGTIEEYECTLQVSIQRIELLET